MRGRLLKLLFVRHYTDEDVAKAYYLQNKFENVSTIAKDSCFHFHYQGMKEERDYDNNVKMVPSTIEKHFDFRLNGSLDMKIMIVIIVAIMNMVMLFIVMK